MMASSHEQKSGLRLFVDNSNVFISGKKEAAKKLKLSTPFDYLGDPRFRIDFGRIIRTVEQQKLTYNGSQAIWRQATKVVDAGLYGSEPPPLDTVRRIAKERGFNSEAFFRKSATGSEKEVDIQLATDVVELACTTKPSREDIIVLITGDRDFKPAVEKALKRNWRVEMWGFASSMSSYYNELVEKLWDGKPRLMLLDLTPMLLSNDSTDVKEFYAESSIHEKSIGFIEYRTQMIGADSTFIAEVDFETLRKLQAQDLNALGRAWCAGLSSRFKWPVIFCWSRNHCLLSFFRVSNQESDRMGNDAPSSKHCHDFLGSTNPSPSAWLHDIASNQSKATAESLIEVYSYQSERWQVNRAPGPSQDFQNPYISLDAEDLDDSEYADNSHEQLDIQLAAADACADDKRDLLLSAEVEAPIPAVESSSTSSFEGTGAASDSDGSGFQIYKNKFRVKAPNRSDRPRCQHLYNCSNGLSCKKLHLPSETHYFQGRSDRKITRFGENPGRKTTLCTYGAESCVRWLKSKPTGPECDFYHVTEMDAWCLKCCTHGHLAQECRTRSKPVIELT